MKKIIALVLALSLLATTVFAEPVVIASEILQTTGTVSEVKDASNLFSDISVPQLNTSEAEAVEGDGIIIVAIVVAAAITVASVVAVKKGVNLNPLAPR
jgi:hypothetical protein